MKFLCLGFYDEAKFDALGPADLEKLGEDCRQHDGVLHRTGKVLAVASLEHRRARTVRSRKGRPAITDGPFVEAKEMIGSFFLIEAADLDEAVRIASLHPAAQMGEELGWAIEVRPIAEGCHQ